MGSLSLLHRKEQIVIEAIQLFDRTGLQGFSTKVLAERLGISEATIFKHFRTKNDLLLAMLEHYAQYDDEILRTVLLRGEKPLASIRFYITAFAEYFENYPAITAFVLSDEALGKEPGLTDKVSRVTASRWAFLARLTEAAVTEGEFRSDLEVRSAVDLLTGLMLSVTLRWRRSGCGFPLKAAILSALDTALHAFLVRPIPL